jgi:hypothetical protein
MNAIPMGVDELKELAKLLTEARDVIGEFVPPMQRGGEFGRIYRDLMTKATKLAGMAKREEDRYERDLRGG